jgi:hypothetical protein
MQGGYNSKSMQGGFLDFDPAALGSKAYKPVYSVRLQGDEIHMSVVRDNVITGLSAILSGTFQEIDKQSMGVYNVHTLDNAAAAAGNADNTELYDVYKTVQFSIDGNTTIVHLPRKDQQGQVTDMEISAAFPENTTMSTEAAIMYQQYIVLIICQVLSTYATNETQLNVAISSAQADIQRAVEELCAVKVFNCRGPNAGQQPQAGGRRRRNW